MLINNISITSINKENLTEFFCNDILVATKEKSLHHFHSITNGRISTLRDKEKIGYVCKWNEIGLTKLFGKTNMVIDIDCIDDKLFRGKKTPDFINCYPDYRSGYNGNLFSKLFIKDSILRFKNK